MEPVPCTEELMLNKATVGFLEIMRKIFDAENATIELEVIGVPVAKLQQIIQSNPTAGTGIPYKAKLRFDGRLVTLYAVDADLPF